jgi:hypothetical protein
MCLARAAALLPPYSSSLQLDFVSRVIQRNRIARCNALWLAVARARIWEPVLGCAAGQFSFSVMMFFVREGVR